MLKLKFQFWLALAGFCLAGPGAYADAGEAAVLDLARGMRGPLEGVGIPSDEEDLPTVALGQFRQGESFQF